MTRSRVLEYFWRAEAAVRRPATAQQQQQSAAAEDPAQEQLLDMGAAGPEREGVGAAVCDAARAFRAAAHAALFCSTGSDDENTRVLFRWERSMKLGAADARLLRQVSKS